MIAAARLEARPAAVDLRNGDRACDQRQGAVQAAPPRRESGRARRAQLHEELGDAKRPVEMLDLRAIRHPAVVREQQRAQPLADAEGAAQIGLTQPGPGLEQAAA